MKKNVGGIDKVLRIVVGLVLLGLAGTDAAGLTNTIGWWGLIGLMPLVTGLVGFCALYPLLGVNTCPLRKNQ